MGLRLMSSSLLTLGATISLIACSPQSVTSAQDIKPTVSVEDIENNYMRTRLLTVVHRWLELVENPNRTADPFKEVVADEIYFDFSSGAIENFDDLAAWIKGPASSVAYSKHDLSGFSFKSTGDNQYELNVTMDWQGLLPDGQRMSAKTQHNWTVVDNPSETFARIKTINVEVLEPFVIISSE